jgi:hypothetical protein
METLERIILSKDKNKTKKDALNASCNTFPYRFPNYQVMKKAIKQDENTWYFGNDDPYTMPIRHTKIDEHITFVYGVHE